jgi:hypothetical protein
MNKLPLNIELYLLLLLWKIRPSTYSLDNFIAFFTVKLISSGAIFKALSKRLILNTSPKDSLLIDFFSKGGSDFATLGA